MNTRPLFVATLAIGSAVAFGSTVTVTPSNLQGWGAADLRGDGTAAITSTYARSGNGSLEFTGSTDSPSYKSNFVQSNASTDLLSTLTSISVDFYRNSNSTVAAHLAPAVRFLVDNGQQTDRYSYLIWEPVYNGVSSVPTDSWTHYDLFGGKFWQRAFKTVGGGVTIENYNLTLTDWLTGNTFNGAPGEVSNVVGANAHVLSYEIGIGSGWTGQFNGAADNFTVGYGGSDTTYNFEVVPAPGAAAALGLAGLVGLRRRRR